MTTTTTDAAAMLDELERFIRSRSGLDSRLYGIGPEAARAYRADARAEVQNV